MIQLVFNTGTAKFIGKFKEGLLRAQALCKHMEITMINDELYGKKRYLIF